MYNTSITQIKILFLLTILNAIRQTNCLAPTNYDSTDHLVKKTTEKSTMRQSQRRFSLRIAASAFQTPDRNPSSASSSHSLQIKSVAGLLKSPGKHNYDCLANPVTPDSINDSSRKHSRSRKRKSSTSTSGTKRPDYAVSVEADTIRSDTIVSNNYLSNDSIQRSLQNPWIDLQVPPSELRPSATLTTGQCFQWKAIANSASNEDQNSDNINSSSAWGSHKATEWVGVLEDRVLNIKETSETTLVRVLHGPPHGIKEMLWAYFQLKIPLTPLYQQWRLADPNWFDLLPQSSFQGVRILQQDPVECLFSFLCSSNNNIPRITTMLAKLRQRYGKKLSDGISSSDSSYYSFPTLEELMPATEEELRQMGLGYRAPFIIKTRDLLVQKGGKEYLLSLRGHPDPEFVQSELMQFVGVGRKVADCIALFSLAQVNVVPVDTHVQQIACREYCDSSDQRLFRSKKSLTPALYTKVGNLFRTRFPSYTGWAHTVLFIAELPSFRPALPEDMVKRIDSWSDTVKKQKVEKVEL